MLILLLSLVATAEQTAASLDTRAPAADEIVVTAKHDKCFMEYAKHQISPQELSALSSTWALGTPVRVIEPRGASIRCEFQIMKLLSKHGAHLAQFVPRVEDRENDSADLQADTPAAPATRPSSSPPTLPRATAPAPSPPTAMRRREAGVRAPMPVGISRSGIVTLTCLMADPVKPYPLDVEINESRGTATPSRPDTGAGSEMKATFMPNTVRFGPFTIDRTTLRIERMEAPSVQTATRDAAAVQGQCSIAQNLKRAF